MFTDNEPTVQGSFHARRKTAQRYRRPLGRLAKETGRTKTYYVREAILEYLDDLEDAYLAASRYEDWKADRSRTHTLAEVEQRLGLAD